MKVVLLKRFKGLGYSNDIVDVADGYARNYLIPNSIAIFASKSAIKMAKENLRQGEKKYNEEKQKALNIAEKIKDITLNIKANADENGKLFAKVNAKNILKAVYNQTNYNIDDVIFEKPIDKLGKSNVKLVLHKDVSVSVNVEVSKI
jgi:large subunit ribosomal protein L9